ncbi:MAG TPA: DUF6259 domain-containing protein [Bacteroidota bacterium]|nr:DUF6259 domain-containing protein [Bacteroidota bacterium]
MLQDAKLLVAFDSGTGALIKMENKTTNWVIERRPELGASFRLIASTPEFSYNFVYGDSQKIAEVQKLSDHEIRIEWKNLKSDNGETLPITFTATVTLHDGALMFDAALDNGSSLTVETIEYPYFGDLNPPNPSTSMVVHTTRYDHLVPSEIYPRFVGAKDDGSVSFPTKAFDSARSLFCLIQSPREGLYVEMHDPTQPYLLQYTFEQHPGVVSSMTNEVRQEGKLSQIFPHLEFRTCHFIFAHSHSLVKLVTVVVRCYSGDWHAGVDLYKQWRQTWFKQPRVPDWAKGVNSWMQLQIDSPEQDYRVKYTELVRYGEECAENGVSAIQLVGWNKGGQDGGNPSLDTDPGLGSWQQLHDAIEKIQAMGVKIILFGKFPWADMTTDWYKQSLYHYAVTDPYGIPYEGGGDSYFTPVQLAGINNHRFAIMDLADPEYRSIATQEFRKTLALGASGFLYDEVCVQPTNHAYCFNEHHGHGSPAYIYAGAIPLAEEFHAAADSVDKDFLFAGEGPQDWLTQYYPFSYFRISASSIPVERYIDTQAPLMVAVDGFDDREMINFCLMDRYIIEYEPYNFKGRLSDFPLTLEYGKKVDALRRKYKEYLWDGKFLDTEGASITANGPCRYSVFVTKSGKRAVILFSTQTGKEITAKVELPDAGPLVWASPDHPDAKPTNGTLRLPERSAAVIMEK